LEITASQEPYFAEHLSAYGADTQLSFALAASLPATLYVRAQRIRARVARGTARALSGVDVIATPTTACLPPKVPPDALGSGESNLGLFEAIMRFVTIPNLVGLPAISVPAGYVGNLPVGLQLIGPAWHEHVLLRVARALDSATPRRVPEVHYRLLGERAPLARGNARVENQ
jgi:Asp-tRNA(Asn)/Glu-tRNA(Gln) amidotransferase A subunit family amidase